VDPRIDVRVVTRVRSHLESPEILGVGIGDEEQVLDFLTRLSMEDVEALVGSAVEPNELTRLLGVIEHRKGLLDDHELPPSEAEGRAELLESLKSIAADRRGGRRG
jgi:hypothetical protein